MLGWSQSTSAGASSTRTTRTKQMLHAIAFSRPPVRRESRGLGAALPMARVPGLPRGALPMGLSPDAARLLPRPLSRRPLRPTHDRSGKPNNAIAIPRSQCPGRRGLSQLRSILCQLLGPAVPCPVASAVRSRRPADSKFTSESHLRSPGGYRGLPEQLGHPLGVASYPDPPAEAAEAGPGRTSGRSGCFCGSINNGAPPKRPSLMRAGAPRPTSGHLPGA
jgi:hypothetical protein